jgi:hypothetical protein
MADLKTDTSELQEVLSLVQSRAIDTSALETEDKTIVGAINEINSKMIDKAPKFTVPTEYSTTVVDMVTTITNAGGNISDWNIIILSGYTTAAVGLQIANYGDTVYNMQGINLTNGRVISNVADWSGVSISSFLDMFLDPVLTCPYGDLKTTDQTIVGAINELNSGKMPRIQFTCGPITKFMEIVEAIRNAGEIDNFISLQLDGYLRSDLIVKVSNSEGSTMCSIVGITNHAGTLYYASGAFDASAVYAEDVAYCDNNALGSSIWKLIVSYDTVQRLVDEKASEVKNDLLNGAGAAYDTLKELGDLIDANTTALDALETVATNKADKGHNHSKSEITDFPTLATVATSGNYNDLSNKPTIPAEYSLPEAGSSLGGVKSGGDVTISGGVITVNDDSHNHTIANIDELQTTLNAKLDVYSVGPTIGDTGIIKPTVQKVVDTLKLTIGSPGKLAYIGMGMMSALYYVQGSQTPNPTTGSMTYFISALSIPYLEYASATYVGEEAEISFDDFFTNNQVLNTTNKGIFDAINELDDRLDALVGDYSRGLEYTLNEDEASYTVTGIGTCTDTDIVIPMIYNGLLVTSIGSSAFKQNTAITSVKIPDSVTTISNKAFYECAALVNATIGNSVTTIGEDAFAYCSLLANVVLPNSLISIGTRGFRECLAFTSISIPNSVQSIGDWAFMTCDSLTSLTIPSSVTTMGARIVSRQANKIYCEASVQPEGWAADWNYYDRPVYWGCGMDIPGLNATIAALEARIAALEAK